MSFHFLRGISLILSTSPLFFHTSFGQKATASCNSRLQASQQPDVYNVVFDSDDLFVYNAENCASTNQKIIPSGFPVIDCAAAIEAICGTTSNVSAVAGSWTWAWHTTQGSTCQAGLYQAINADSNGVGFLDEKCCLANFQAMNKLLTPTPGAAGKPQLDPEAGNRLSVNIAPGGFPYTAGQYKGGKLVNEDGLQMTTGYPSYILQA